MKSTPFLVLSTLALAAVSSGCIVEAHPRTVRTVTVERTVTAPAPAPVVVAPAPASGTAAPAYAAPDYETQVIEHEEVEETGIQVVEVPPAPMREIVVVRPSPRHVWIGGYWRWVGARYVWVGGHWTLPPRKGYIWVGPRVVVRNGAHFYVGGGWHSAHHRRH